MDHWVALLRGVNVGGGNKVPMADLRALATGLGWQDARTYVASGNLVFRATGRADDLADRLRQAMVAGIGIDVPVLVLPGARLRAIAAACPFGPDAGARVHGFLLWQPAQIDAALYAALRAPDEVLQMGDGVVWLSAPAGIGRSKLAEKLHKVVTGSQMTGRNLNTLAALARMTPA